MRIIRLGLMIVVLCGIGLSLLLVLRGTRSASLATPTKAVSEEEKMNVIATAAGPVELSARPVRVTLTFTASTSQPSASFASQLAALRSDQEIYLVLKDVRVAEQPGVLYHLYLDLPAGADARAQEAHYIGNLNFYNAVAPGSSEAETSKGSIFRSYEISGLARNLQARRLLSEATSLTILPAGAPASEAKPVIGRIELVKQ